METPVCQRWRDGRSSYRPAGEPIETSRYEIAPIADDTTARDYVVAHHYARSYPAARARFGLYRSEALVGVAVFSHPVNERTLAPFGGAPAIELGRLVLDDDVPANGESWFVARCFELLRAEGIGGVVSFADPVPRTDTQGERVFPGHAGTIYQALNARYTGRSRAETRRLLPDGTVLHNRALAKLRGRERGWEYVVEGLVRHGAAAPGADLEAWLADVLATLVRPLAHAGNHRYLFALARPVRRTLERSERSLPYPKLDPRALVAPAGGGQTMEVENR
jgi:hypothetical protein